MTDEKTCQRCGRCCSVLPLFTQHMHPEFKRYLLTRGLSEDKEQGCILIPHVCQHLKLIKVNGFTMSFTEGGIQNAYEYQHSCDIHDSPDRPEVCVKFRGQRMIKGSRIYVPPGCSYRKEE